MACKVIELNQPNYKLMAKALVTLHNNINILEEHKKRNNKN
jgi:hypothetical protein